MPRQPDILIVGGGIIGLACARELDRRRHRVAVLEGREPGSGASTAAAGLLSPLSEEHPSSEFLHLCLAARDLWCEWSVELEDATGVALGHDRSGALVPVLDEEDELYRDRLVGVARDADEPFETVKRDRLRRWVPDISPAAESALLLPGEHRVDNVQVMAALEADLARRAVPIHRQRPVRRIEAVPRRGQDGSGQHGVVVSGSGWRAQAALVVIAAGAWSAQIEGLPRPPVRPVRGQMISFEGTPWPWRGSIRTGSGYAVRRGPDRLLVGATVEEVGFDPSLTAAARGDLVAASTRLFPSLAGSTPSAHWAGLRPGSLDELPILGWPSDLPVIWATGHYRNGILLAPWTARHVAEMASASERSDPVDLLSPARFRRSGIAG